MLACSLYVAGCASQTRPRSPAPVVPSKLGLADNGLTADSFNPALEALCSARRKDSKDFAVGPGDVLEIQVTGVKELDICVVRVDGNGDIDLPWSLGSVHEPRVCLNPNPL